MDSNANIRKPLRARKTMSPSCRKQVEILRKLHGLGKNGSSTDSVDKYVQLRMVGTNVLNYGSYSKTNLNHALGETTKEPVAKLVVNSEISICNNSGDLSSDLPYKTNSEEEQFFNAGSLQDMLYTLYQNNPRNPVSRPVEVHLFSESSDQPLGGSKEQTSSLASPAGNLSAVVAAEERTEQIPDNHAVALLEHEALPDNTLRKRKPSGCEEDVTSKPCKSDEPAEDSKRRKTSECEEVVIQKCLGSSDEMAEGSRKRKTSECEEVVICKRLESSSEITEDSGTQLDKSQSGIDKVKCFIRSEIENVVGNLDHKVQQLNGRFDNTQSQQKDSRIAIRIVKKIAKLNRRVNSLMAFQQAQLLNKAICPGASAKNAILNAAKPVSGIPDNSSVPPSRLLHRAPPTTAQRLRFSTFCPEMAQKRFSYSAEFKLKVIQFAKLNGNRAAERMFGPPPTEKTIRDWLREEETLLQMPQQKKAMRGKSAQWPDLERELKRWIEEQRAVGIPVSRKMVQHEARKIAAEKEIADFKGGHSWCFRFMTRNRITMRTRPRLAQKMPESYE